MLLRGRPTIESADLAVARDLILCIIIAEAIRSSMRSGVTSVTAGDSQLSFSRFHGFRVDMHRHAGEPMTLLLVEPSACHLPQNDFLDPASPLCVKCGAQCIPMVRRSTGGAVCPSA